MKNIGILGGSFDPFHYGHLSIGKSAIDEFNLSKVILLPAKVSPFKIGRKMADTEHRLNMLRLIEKYNDKFELSTFETENTDVSYTYKTLVSLRELYPNTKFWFIMGTDSLVHLETWYEGEKLINEFSFIIGARPGFNKKEVEAKIAYYEEKYNADIKIMHNSVLDISSTRIKENIKMNRTIDEFVPPCIEEYINENRLYI